MYVAIRLVPGIESTVWTAIAATWVSAVVGTLISWATTAGTDDGLITSLAGRARRPETVSDPEVDGIVFVQLDGVPFPVLQWAIPSGAVPTMRRWVTRATTSSASGRPSCPAPRQPASWASCTAPSTGFPPSAGTTASSTGSWSPTVRRTPRSSRSGQQRPGPARDGGVSVSNMFTGDAPRSLLTMSRVKVGRGSTQRGARSRGSSPTPRVHAGFVRTIAEIVKERFQARRQVRDLDPRVHRGWTFAVLRAATNVLRDLNTAIITEEMRKGTRSIYVDYVDYDEIAHHAGIFRPESLAALEGLDRVLGTLERLAETGARRYHFVIVSDHGQSQGRCSPTGTATWPPCAALMKEQVESVDAPVEGWGRAEAVADGIGTSGVTGKFAGRANEADGTRRRHATARRRRREPTCWGRATSGCSTCQATALTLDDLEERWPALVPVWPRTRESGSSPGSTRRAVRGRSGAAGARRHRRGAGRRPARPYGGTRRGCCAARCCWPRRRIST